MHLFRRVTLSFVLVLTAVCTSRYVLIRVIINSCLECSIETQKTEHTEPTVVLIEADEEELVLLVSAEAHARHLAFLNSAVRTAEIQRVDCFDMTHNSSVGGIKSKLKKRSFSFSLCCFSAATENRSTAYPKWRC